MQQKTQRPVQPVQFEITEQTRASVEAWIKAAALASGDYLFPGRIHGSPHVSTRQHVRLVHRWIRSVALDDAAYRTHPTRCTKASLIYHRTKNLRAVQLLLGRSKLDSTVRYLVIEVDAALEMTKQTDASSRNARQRADAVRPTRNTGLVATNDRIVAKMSHRCEQ